MKLSGRDAAQVFRKPDPACTGYLIYGEDVMRVALRRQDIIAALIGPDGEGEMRLTRMAAADLRKDAAALNDAVKAHGFFPGPRVVLVEDATDGLADTLGHALTDWRAGDAQLIVTAASLTAKSALRKLFEAHRTAHAIGLYDDPPSEQIRISCFPFSLNGEGCEIIPCLPEHYVPLSGKKPFLLEILLWDLKREVSICFQESEPKPHFVSYSAPLPP